MNEHNEHNAGGPAVSGHLLDLLADGELSAEEYRTLLGRISREPDGWRHCAMAFLEAQALRRDLGGLTVGDAVERCRERPLRRSAPAADPGNAAEGIRYRRKWFSPGIVYTRLALLGMAASFLVAFGIGWLIRPLSRPAGVPAPYVAVDPIAEQLPAVPTRDARPEDVPDAGLPAPWQMVTLSVPEAGPAGSRSIRLPAIERQWVDKGWFDALPKAVPPEVLRALRQSGHEVRQSRELLPVPMNDGRQLIVPMDQVEVRYVGAKAYQ